MDKKSQRQIKNKIQKCNLKPKQIEELNFWSNIRKNEWRGFTTDEWRIANIYFRKYFLMYINRSISDLENKVVIEVGCGPTAVISHLNNTTAIGVDPLIDEYQKMWDLSNDKVKYICSEIETFKTDIQADVVICWNVLDHVSNIELATDNIFNILKTDGELWFMINLEDTGISWKVVKRNADSAHPYKVNSISISKLMNKYGFYWKEKVMIKDCLSNRHPILMGVLKKVISNKENQKNIISKMKKLKRLLKVRS